MASMFEQPQNFYLNQNHRCGSGECGRECDQEKYDPRWQTYEIVDSAMSKYALRTSRHALLLECE